MAIVQVHRRTVHAVVETIQDKTAGGEGAIKAPGAGAAVSCSGRDSAEKVISILWDFCPFCGMVELWLFSDVARITAQITERESLLPA